MKKLKLFKKLNTKGFTHHFIIPVIAIVAVAGIGAYVVTKPKAATQNPLSSEKVCENATFNRTWKNGTCTKTCKSGYNLVVSNPYDYCAKAGTKKTAKKVDSSNPLKSKETCEGSYYKRTWKNGTCSKTCQSGFSLVTANPYDYCRKGAAVTTKASDSKSSPAKICSKGDGGRDYTVVKQEPLQYPGFAKEGTIYLLRNKSAQKFCGVIISSGKYYGKSKTMDISLTTFGQKYIDHDPDRELDNDYDHDHDANFWAGPVYASYKLSAAQEKSKDWTPQRQVYIFSHFPITSLEYTFSTKD